MGEAREHMHLEETYPKEQHQGEATLDHRWASRVVSPQYSKVYVILVGKLSCYFFLARSQYFQECKNISTMIFFPQVIPEEPVDAEIKIFLTSAYLLNAKHDVLTLTILITH